MRWALSPVLGREPLRVLDLAAGTGKLTAALVRLGAKVTAVEPGCPSWESSGTGWRVLTLLLRDPRPRGPLCPG